MQIRLVDTGRDYTDDSDRKLVGISWWGIFGDTYVAQIVPSSRSADPDAKQIDMRNRD